jgi:hypothetical protein
LANQISIGLAIGFVIRERLQTRGEIFLKSVTAALFVA